MSDELKVAVKAMEERMRERVGLIGSLEIVELLYPRCGFVRQPPISHLKGTLERDSRFHRIELLPCGTNGHFVWVLKDPMGPAQGPLYEWDGMSPDDASGKNGMREAREAIGIEIAENLEAVVGEFGDLFKSLDLRIVPGWYDGLWSNVRR